MANDWGQKMPARRSLSGFFWVGLALASLLGWCLLTPAATTAAVLWVDGHPLQSSTPIRAAEGYLLVPARATFAPLGVEITSQGPDGLQLSRPGRRLGLQAGSRTGHLNGEPFALPVPPERSPDEWLVPLSAVAIALQLDLRWDDQMRALQLSRGGGVDSPSAATRVLAGSGRSGLPPAPSGAGGTTALVQVTLDSSPAGTADHSPVDLVFRSELPFTVQLGTAAPAAREAGASGAAAQQQWQLRISATDAHVKVALPAVLPGHWPGPWRQVNLISSLGTADPRELAAATGDEAVVEIALAPGYAPVGSWPLLAQRESPGSRYEVRVRVASIPGPVAQVPSPALLSAETQLEFSRRPGQSAVLVLGTPPGSAAWQYATEVWRDPDRVAITVSGWRWAYSLVHQDLTDPDFSAIEVRPADTPAGGAAGVTPSAQVVLWLRHPGWVRVVRPPDRPDSLQLDVLRMVEQVRLASPHGRTNEGAAASSEMAAAPPAPSRTDQTAVLQIDASGPVALRRVFRLPDPERLVIDLAGVANPVGGPRQSALDPGWIRQLRVSQFDPHTVRIVAELAQPIDAEISQTQDGQSILAVLRAAAPPATATAITVGELHPPADPPAAAIRLPASPRPPGGQPSGPAVVTRPPSPAGNQSDPGAAPAVRAPDAAAPPDTAAARAHLRGRLIVLDAGHGGRDPGAIGVNGVQEKDVALSLVLQLQRVLEADGARVLLTRGDDTLVDWAQRVAPANLNHADALLSIHLNSYQGGPSAHGVETYYRSDQDQSRRLAQALQQSLVERLQAYDGGARARDDLYVVRQSWVPTVLLEVGYLSNPDEAAKLADAAYQAQVVQAIAAGLERYFGANLP